MKRINQNQIQIKEASNAKARPSFFSKPSQKQYTTAGAAILAIIVLHFASSFFFFRGENLQNEQTAVKTEIEQTAETKPVTEKNNETKAPELKEMNVATTPAAVLPKVQDEPVETPVAPRATKKKMPRESRQSAAERLRRAEKILTGI